MIQSITRNTHTQSEKAKILLPCFDRDDNSNKNKNSRKQKMSLCQGFQSCLLEPRVIIAPSKAGLSLPWPHKQSHATMLESSSNHAYVHPLSTSFLSAKSLEMCTESIGSETGSGIDRFSSYHVTTEERERERESQSCVKPRGSIKKVTKHGGGFPPPLTSISGSQGVVRVRAHREGGRLVIEAFTLSSSRCSFVAERGDGRLRLSLQKGGGGEKEHLYVKDGCGKVGCVYGGIRCNGGERKRLQSLPFFVAGIS